MRKIQKLSPRVFSTLEEAIKDLVSFDEKFEAINKDGKKTYESKVTWGTKTLVEIEIYEL